MNLLYLFVIDTKPPYLIELIGDRDDDNNITLKLK